MMQGYDVVTFDLPSHGRSQCIKGIRGYLDSFQGVVDDTEHLLDHVRRGSRAVGLDGNSPRRVFVMGESLGGAIVFALSTRQSVQCKVSGVILSAPVLQVAQAVLPPKPGEQGSGSMLEIHLSHRPQD